MLLLIVTYTIVYYLISTNIYICTYLNLDNRVTGWEKGKIKGFCERGRLGELS